MIKQLEINYNVVDYMVLSDDPHIHYLVKHMNLQSKSGKSITTYVPCLRHAKANSEEWLHQFL